MSESLLLMGSNSRTRACLDALVAVGERVSALALDRDAPALAEHSRRLGVAVIDGRRPRSAEGRAALAAVGADRWIMAGYARILPPEALAIPPAGVINLHGGRLPEYRGASVVNWQIIEGEAAVGLTVLRADAGIDTGDILVRDTLAVDPDEDYGSVRARMDDRFPQLLCDALRGLRDGTLVGEPQDLAAGRTWRQRRPEDGRIDWSAPARRIHDFVRALAKPCPGAFTALGEARVTVWQVARGATPGLPAAPGTVTGQRDGCPVVATGDGAVVITVHDGPQPRVGDILGGPR